MQREWRETVQRLGVGNSGESGGGGTVEREGKQWGETGNVCRERKTVEWKGGTSGVGKGEAVERERNRN